MSMNQYSVCNLTLLLELMYSTIQQVSCCCTLLLYYVRLLLLYFLTVDDHLVSRPFTDCAFRILSSFSLIDKPLHIFGENLVISSRR
jgi:hypothetical protein